MLWSGAYKLQHCVGKTRNASMGWFLGLGFRIFSDQFCSFLLLEKKMDSS